MHIRENKLSILRMIKTVGLIVLSCVALLGAGCVANEEESDSWGPTDREIFTSSSPASYITFNSITDNPTFGDERRFVRIREAGSSMFETTVEIEAGKTYEIWVYVHNNASAELNETGEGLAQNVTLSIDMPARLESGQTGVVTATLSSSNATPTSVWASAYYENRSDRTLYLRYVHDSAVITNSGSASGSILDAASLFSDNGAFLAYSSISWGNIPGGDDYAGYVILQVVADYVEFSATKEVSISGIDNFTDTVTVRPGATLDFVINYSNSGSTEQTYVTVYDFLPEHLNYVPGSLTITRSDGTVVELEDEYSIFDSGAVIGDYKGGESAIISYQATVDGEESFVDDTTTLYNQSLVATANGEISDKTEIVVDCT